MSSQTPRAVINLLRDLGVSRVEEGYAFNWSGFSLTDDEEELINALPTGRKLLRLVVNRYDKERLEQSLANLYESMLEKERQTRRDKKTTAMARTEADKVAKLRAEFEAKAHAAEVEAELRAEAKARVRTEVEAELRAEFKAKARIGAESEGGGRCKKPIKKHIRNLVWNTYFGQSSGDAKCWCCNVTTITQGGGWHCGHVVAEAHGGSATVPNLRPICPGCNLGMGKQNMLEFKQVHFPTQHATII